MHRKLKLTSKDIRFFNTFIVFINVLYLVEVILFYFYYICHPESSLLINYLHGNDLGIVIENHDTKLGIIVNCAILAIDTFFIAFIIFVYLRYLTVKGIYPDTDFTDYLWDVAAIKRFYINELDDHNNKTHFINDEFVCDVVNKYIRKSKINIDIRYIHRKVRFAVWRNMYKFSILLAIIAISTIPIDYQFIVYNNNRLLDKYNLHADNVLDSINNTNKLFKIIKNNNDYVADSKLVYIIKDDKFEFAFDYFNSIKKTKEHIAETIDKNIHDSVKHIVLEPSPALIEYYKNKHQHK